MKYIKFCVVYLKFLFDLSYKGAIKIIRDILGGRRGVEKMSPDCNTDNQWAIFYVFKTNSCWNNMVSDKHCTVEAA